MNLLLFGQVEAKPVQTGNGYAQAMAEKIAAFSDLRAAISAPERAPRGAYASSDIGGTTGALASADGDVDQAASEAARPKINSLTFMSNENLSALLTLQEIQTANPTEQDMPSASTDAAEFFLEYASKTPAERYYESLLQSMGLTKEELAKLPPEQRAKIEDMIQEKMRQHMETSMAEGPA